MTPEGDEDKRANNLLIKRTALLYFSASIILVYAIPESLAAYLEPTLSNQSWLPEWLLRLMLVANATPFPSVARLHILIMFALSIGLVWQYATKLRPPLPLRLTPIFNTFAAGLLLLCLAMLPIAFFFTLGGMASDNVQALSGRAVYGKLLVKNRLYFAVLGPAVICLYAVCVGASIMVFRLAVVKTSNYVRSHFK